MAGFLEPSVERVDAVPAALGAAEDGDEVGEEAAGIGVFGHGRKRGSNVDTRQGSVQAVRAWYSCAMVSHHHRPLGKHAARHDARTLSLVKYMKRGAELSPPASQDWGSTTNKKWPMYLNDEIGCCTCASAAHHIEAWTAAGSKGKREVEIKAADVLAAYRAVGGYNPADPSTDGGANMLDVLKYWRKVGIGRHKIGAFVSVSLGSKELVSDAIWLFGGLYVGVDLPLSAQTQEVWDVAPGPKGAKGSWGGHAIAVVSYDARGLVCVTWGETKLLTWPFLRRYGDEGYAILSPDFVTARRKAPSGFDMATLMADLRKIAA